jgi:branched-chain amino acid transport system substrate-binding protein
VRPIRVVILASAALLVPVAGGCSSPKPTGDTSPIVIGADLELSGADAAIGTTYARALQLRVDQLNAQGGVDGRRITLETKDNRTDASLSVANVNAFLTEPGIAGVILGGCTPCAEDVAKTVDDKEVPTVSLAPGNGVTRPVAERRYMFKVGPNIDDSASALVTALKDASIRTAALLTTDDANGSDAQSAFTSQAARAQINVVNKQSFRATDTDLSQPVRAATQKNPNALVVSTFPGQATLVAKTARDAGYSGKLFFDATAAGDLFLGGDVAGAVEGTIMVAPQTLVIDDVVATTPAKTARKRWFDDYTSKYGAFSGYSTYAGDAIKLLADAVHIAGGPKHRQMRDVMEDTTFDGLSGLVRFTPGNHSGLMSQALTSVVARSGRWRLFG